MEMEIVAGLAAQMQRIHPDRYLAGTDKVYATRGIQDRNSSIITGR